MVFDDFCRKKTKDKCKRVADLQDVGVKKLRGDWFRFETVRVEIGQILRTDFCVQGCYSSIDGITQTQCDHDNRSTGIFVSFLLGMPVQCFIQVNIVM